MKILISLAHNQERERYFRDISDYLAGRSYALAYIDLTGIVIDNNRYSFLKNRYGEHLAEFEDEIHTDTLRLVGKSGQAYGLLKSWIEHHALNLIDEIENDDIKLIILWNQFKPPHFVFKKIADKFAVPVRYMHLGVLPGSIVFEEKGQMAECDLMGIQLEDSYTDKKRTLRYIDIVSQGRINRKEQPKNNLLDKMNRIKKKYRKAVFYAGQNDYESGIYPRSESRSFIHSPHYASTSHALKDIAEYCFKNDYMLIFKPHPNIAKYHKEEYAQAIGGAVNVFYDDSLNIYDCIQASDITVTILSQVSYHSMFMKKNTLLLGNSPMCGFECVNEMTRYSSLTSAMDCSIASGLTKEMYSNFCKHVDYLLNHYLYCYEDVFDGYFEKGRYELARDIYLAAETAK